MRKDLARRYFQYPFRTAYTYLLCSVCKGNVVKTLITLQTCQIWSLEVVRELSHNEKWVL